MTKNIHAVILGRRGGKATARKLKATGKTTVKRKNRKTKRTSRRPKADKRGQYSLF